MTEENKKQNIAEEIARARDSMRAADLLFENGLINDAVSRLYHFVLYHIRALLLSKGLEPKSHEGALRLFGLHFVKEGQFEAKASHVFSKLMKYREEADYNPSYTFTKEDYMELRQEAETLSSATAACLKQKGYL
ncbi:MAG: HEPN domain-containing protein [Nitrospiraceae bacterium]|nr:HEPN domain-containing protein [Nitrospiraceae bacterium]